MWSTDHTVHPVVAHRVCQLIFPPLCGLEAKNRCSHIFSRCHPKLACSISFFSYVPALTNGPDYATIPCNRTKIQKTRISSTVVEKLIGRLTNLIGHCFTFWLIAQLSDVLAIKFEGLRNPETYAVPGVCVNPRKNEY